MTNPAALPYIWMLLGSFAFATMATLGTRVPVIFRYNHFRERPPTDAVIRLAYRTTLREQVFLSSEAHDRVLAQTPFMRRVAATTIHEGVDSLEFRPNRRAAAEFRRNVLHCRFESRVSVLPRQHPRQ